MANDNLRERLLSIARDKAISWGFLYGDETDKLIHGIVTGGLETLEREGKIDDRKAHFKAKSNIMRLVDVMIEEARKNEQDTESLELSEDSFEAAKKSFESLWPYF